MHYIFKITKAHAILKEYNCCNVTARGGLPPMCEKDAQLKQEERSTSRSNSRNRIISADLVRRAFIYRGSILVIALRTGGT